MRKTKAKTDTVIYDGSELPVIARHGDYLALDIPGFGPTFVPKGHTKEPPPVPRIGSVSVKTAPGGKQRSESFAAIELTPEVRALVKKYL